MTVDHLWHMPAVKLFSAILRTIKYLFFMIEFSGDSIEQGFLNPLCPHPQLGGVHHPLPPLDYLITL
jgi:hypothetical protein